MSESHRNHLDESIKNLVIWGHIWLMGEQCQWKGELGGQRFFGGSWCPLFWLTSLFGGGGVFTSNHQIKIRGRTCNAEERQWQGATGSGAAEAARAGGWGGQHLGERAREAPSRGKHRGQKGQMQQCHCQPKPSAAACPVSHTDYAYLEHPMHLYTSSPQLTRNAAAAPKKRSSSVPFT